jgi:uncharacterized protein (DUF305 family)
MMNQRFTLSGIRTSLMLILFSGTLVAGFAGCSTSEMTADADTSQTETETAAERDYEQMEEIYWARIDSSKMSFTDADVEFMTGMIGHHAQALIMSDLAPKNDASPAVQRLAARIINAQKDEIATMQRWLRDRNQPVPVVNIDDLILTITMEMPDEGMADGMDADMSEGMEHDSDHEMDHSMSGNDMDHSAMGHHGMDHSNMPGMLTQEQLNELGRLKGEEFDRKFLLYMIDHHQGAVIMSDTLFDTDGAALDEQAFRLAADIKVDQETEIERMKLMLRNMESE